MKQTFVVGDIHGNFKSFKQALESTPINKGDRIIFLGDYVDGWSESAQLVDYLINLQEEYECIFLKGNHDEWCAEWFLYGFTPEIWTNQGGRATLESYMYSDLINEKHRNFFTNLKLWFVDEENRAYVHGGFTSNKGLGYEAFQDTYYWDRTLWSLSKLLFEDEDVKDVLQSYVYKEVYIGHTTVLPETVPVNRFNIWNMDTGGGFGGVVTIMNVDTKEYYQGKTGKDNYPNEMGR